MSNRNPGEQSSTISPPLSVDVSTAKRSFTSIQQKKAAFRTEGEPAVKRVAQVLLTALERFRVDLERQTDRFPGRGELIWRQVKNTPGARRLTESRDEIGPLRKEWLRVLDAVDDGNPRADLCSIVSELRNITIVRRDKPLQNPDKEPFQMLDVVPHWVLDSLDAAIGILRGFVGSSEAVARPKAPAATPALKTKRKSARQPALMRAAASYEWVCGERPELIPKKPARYAREQWAYIHEHGCPAYKDDEGSELKVPTFRTWTRQVRGGLADPENPKSTPRAGRPHGTTVIRSYQR